MFFSKRVKKSFEIMQERNRRYLESMKDPDAADAGEAEAAEEEPSSEDGSALEAQAAREIEEEIREDAEEIEEPGAPEEDLGPAEEKTARRMRYAPVRDPSAEEAEEKVEEFHREENKLEKGDIPAMILSAFLVFGPIFLVLGGILALAWIFLH